MTRKSDLRRLNELLKKRRESIEASSKHAGDELRALKEQERDPEYEESAQTELADYTLYHLVENARRELMMIDAAFARMEQGTYGECVDCGQDIPLLRLEALPFAIRCEDDQRQQEEAARGPHAHAPTL